MHFLTYILLVGFLEMVFGNSIFASDQTAYDELRELNVSCYPIDSCKENRAYDSPTIFYEYRCSCHSECSEFSTCCIDSPYRKHLPSTKQCRSVELPVSPYGNSGSYMIHKCPNDSDNNIWKSLCEQEWNGNDDVLIIAPVISLDTNTTYKSYYCFRCHETTTNFLYWNLFLRGNYQGSDTFDQNDLSVTYDRTTDSWIATAAHKNVSFPVTLKFEIPKGFEDSLNECNPRIISNCSASWTDKSVQDKCNSYTALLSKRFNTIFKNGHCALCNFESLDQLSCEKSKVFSFKKILSFAHLIDVNISDGDKVGKVDRCEANQIWDPYRRKCSKLVCVIPGYVIKNGHCSPP